MDGFARVTAHTTTYPVKNLGITTFADRNIGVLSDSLFLTSRIPVYPQVA